LKFKDESPYDRGLVLKEISDCIAIRELELTEIELDKHKFLPKNYKFILGFEGTHYRHSEYVFINND
jgi:hypothetical protein